MMKIISELSQSNEMGNETKENSKGQKNKSKNNSKEKIVKFSFVFCHLGLNESSLHARLKAVGEYSWISSDSKSIRRNTLTKRETSVHFVGNTSRLTSISKPMSPATQKRLEIETKPQKRNSQCKIKERRVSRDEFKRKSTLRRTQASSQLGCGFVPKK